VSIPDVWCTPTDIRLWGETTHENPPYSEFRPGIIEEVPGRVSQLIRITMTSTRRPTSRIGKGSR